MRDSSCDQLPVWCRDELVDAAIAAVPMTAWAVLACGLAAVGTSIPGVVAPVVSALASTLVCAGLVALGRRRRTLARPMTLALASSVVALPWVHGVTLSWLSAPQVGTFGDAAWSLLPTSLYGITGNPFVTWGPTVVMGVAGVASLVAARALLAAFGRGRRGAALLTTAMALLATWDCAMAVRHGTHPSLPRWLEGFSVLRRVPVRDVDVGRPRTARGTPLAEGVRVWRHDGVDERGRVTLEVRAPSLVQRGEAWTPNAEYLQCDPRAMLTQRRVSDPLMVLSCEQPRWNSRVRRSDEGAVTTVEVHSWEARVYALQVLPRTAPPPAWTVVAALGLLAAFAMLRGDRTVARRALAAWHPYRIAALCGDGARDESARALTGMGAVAVATHAASPWLLVGWTHLANLLDWL